MGGAEEKWRRIIGRDEWNRGGEEKNHRSGWVKKRRRGQEL